MEEIRLQKFIADSGLMSRRAAEEEIKKGNVSVNGHVAELGCKINPRRDTVSYKNQKIFYKKPDYVYIMMNKPAGVVSSTDDGDVTVIDILPEELMRRGLFPAGRLDKDTTGFVLITDDGDFAHRMLSPKNHVSKEYLVTLAEPLENGAEEKFKDGLVLGDGYKCLPAETVCIDDGERLRFKVILREGKYHQIKRMFASCGNKVIALHRCAMGGVYLDSSLKAGGCRELTAEELRAITEK